MKEQINFNKHRRTIQTKILFDIYENRYQITEKEITAIEIAVEKIHTLSSTEYEKIWSQLTKTTVYLQEHALDMLPNKQIYDKYMRYSYKIMDCMKTIHSRRYPYPI